MANLDELKKKLQGDKPEVKAVPKEVKQAVEEPKNKGKKKKGKGGRPTVMTPEVFRKIEEVAALGGSIEEMAMFADINRATLYSYLEDNKEFSDRIDALRERPVLKARTTIMADIESPDTAKWYLERKKRNEFSPKVEVETTTRIIQVDVV